VSLRYLPEHVPQVVHSPALVHEYMHDPQAFLDSLSSARSACELFFSTIDRVDAQIGGLGIARD
jgi:hypothetical protein